MGYIEWLNNYMSVWQTSTLSMQFHRRSIISCATDVCVDHVTRLSRHEINRDWKCTCTVWLALLHFYHHHENNMPKPAHRVQEHESYLEQMWTNFQLGANISYVQPRSNKHLQFGQTQVHGQEVMTVIWSHWVLGWFLCRINEVIANTEQKRKWEASWQYKRRQ